MYLYEKEITVPPVKDNIGMLDYVSSFVLDKIHKDEIPIRFAVTRTDEKGYHCELGLLSGKAMGGMLARDTIFNLQKRMHQNL